MVQVFPILLARLGIGYVSDDAGTVQAGGYSFGVTYLSELVEAFSL